MGKLLPTPASAGTDAGKVPTVQADGSYALAEAGGGLPPATAEDAGKFFVINSDGEAAIADNLKLSDSGELRVTSGDSHGYIYPGTVNIKYVSEHDEGNPFTETSATFGSAGILYYIYEKDGEGTPTKSSSFEIRPNRGITSSTQYTPTNNRDFVQKKYVDDAIAAAIAQLS